MRDADLSELTIPRSEQQPAPGIWLASFGDLRQLEGVGLGPNGKESSSPAGVSTGPTPSLRLLDEPGHLQPAHAEDAYCSVIFDGLLYNCGELSDRFAGSSEPIANEAALVLRAYLCWGEEVLRKIKGIFALIIWDRKRDVLLCARDPLGLYPLFYAEAGHGLLLSTSIKPLVRHPRVSGAVNRAALADHLCRRWPKPEETFFANVSRVPAGHVLRVDRSGRKVSRYWDPVPSSTSVALIGEDELERFDELLDQAVNRFLGLGAAGIYLSGGLDSISVAVIATEITRRKGFPVPWALSLGFPHPECNEEAIQRRVAAILGLPQVLVPFESAVGPQGLLLSALEMNGSWPVPLRNPWRPAYRHLALEAKQRGCRVILTGAGGDEWLTVSPFYMADLIRALNIVGISRLLGSQLRSYGSPRLSLVSNALWRFGVRPLLSAYASRVLGHVAPRLSWKYRRRHLMRKTPKWVAPELALRREINDRIEESIEQDMRESPPTGPYGFYFRDLPYHMSHPLRSIDNEEDFEEGRQMGHRELSPFWDAELVEFLIRTPPQLLNRGGRAKGLVREELGRRFPQVGFERHKKVSAVTFINAIMLAQGPVAWQKLGGTPALIELGVVDATAFTSIMAAASLSSNPRIQIWQSHRLWEVLSLETWLRSRL